MPLGKVGMVSDSSHPQGSHLKKTLLFFSHRLVPARKQEMKSGDGELVESVQPKANS
jgi:hypothetical protein